MSSNRPKARKFPFKNQLLYRRVNFSFSTMAISVTAASLLLALVICIVLLLALSKRDYINFNTRLAAQLERSAAETAAKPEDERLDFIFEECIIGLTDTVRQISVKIESDGKSKSNNILFDRIISSAPPSDTQNPPSSEMVPVNFKYENDTYRHLSFTVKKDGLTLKVTTFENIQDKYIYVIILSIVIGTSLLIVMLSIILLGRFVTRRALRPLANIADSVRNVSDKNLAAGIKPKESESDTAVDELLIELNNMLQRLETSFESQSRFVSDVSHELRIPLTIIQGYIDILLTWGKNDTQIFEESIDSISDEISSMKILVEKLLFLQNLGSGNISLNMEIIDVPSAAEKVRSEMSLLAGSHELITEIKSKKLHIYADRVLLEQAIRAAVDNSLNHTEAGGTIAIGCSTEKNEAVLYISDTGTGISPEHIKMVEERFYRIDSSRSKMKGGSGLGLSIIKASVQAMGGSFDITSEEGRGTVVKFMFAKQ